MSRAGRIASRKQTSIKDPRAWLTHTQNTIYGWTCPGWDFYWGWSPASNAWICQNIYDYFRYTKDLSMLEEIIYPILEGATAFWSEYLIWDGSRLLSIPAYSPEHGPITRGNTYDQSFVTQLFINYLEASDYVSDVDERLWKKVKNKLKC